MFHICLYYVVLSVPCSLVITCWERAGLFALLCVMFFYAFVTLPHRLISVVDGDIAPMNPYQPLPVRILSYANIPVQKFNLC